MNSRQTVFPKLVVLTGGPCSGKSSVLAALATKLPEVHIVPEAAAILINQIGIKPTSNPLQFRNFEETVCRLQRLLENSALKVALIAGKNAVVVDRGTIDNAAYMPGGAGEFQEIMGCSIEEEYKRYSAVICMAMPPEDIYMTNVDNNPCRTESYQLAVKRNTLTVQVWKNHPNFHFVENYSDWHEKKRLALNKIYTAIYP